MDSEWGVSHFFNAKREYRASLLYYLYCTILTNSNMVEMYLQFFILTQDHATSVERLAQKCTAFVGAVTDSMRDKHTIQKSQLNFPLQMLLYLYIKDVINLKGFDKPDQLKHHLSRGYIKEWMPPKWGGTKEPNRYGKWAEVVFFEELWEQVIQKGLLQCRYTNGSYTLTMTFDELYESMLDCFPQTHTFKTICQTFSTNVDNFYVQEKTLIPK